MSMSMQTKISGESLVLKEMFAKGGEGEVWTIEGKPDFIAKTFLKPNPELEQKLCFMVNHPPRDRVKEEFDSPSIAWPVDLLYSNNKFNGYLMPRILGGVEIIEVYNPAHRKKHPEFNWKVLIHVAGNLAAAVHTLHQHKYVIGDINPKNIFVAPQTTLVTIIDTDSFQVEDNQGNAYLCKVTTPLFIPPELTNTNEFRKPEHDYFGLGVMIFYLLMEGVHPFSGSLKRQDDTITQIEEYLLTKKIFPYEKNSIASPHPHAPSYNTLPQNIQDLFYRCFVTGLSDPVTRPNATEWLEALKALENSVVECRNNRNHYYSSHLSYCPWCHKDTDIVQEPLKTSSVPSQPIPQPMSEPKPISVPLLVTKTNTSAFWPAAIVLMIICFVCGVISLPNMGGIGSAGVPTQAQAIVSAERSATLTTEALTESSNSQKQTVTAQAQATATAERKVALTADALAKASNSQKQTATAKARTIAAEEAKTATAEAQANANSANKTATSRAKQSDETAVENVVHRYSSEIKVENTTYLDPSSLDQVLIDPVLEKHKRSSCWLRNEGQYYSYSNRDFTIESVTFSNDRHATVLARIQENMILYNQDGTIGQNFGREDYRAIYQLKKLNDDKWYIYCFQAIKDNAPARCEVKLEGDDPCQ